jgi:hypothetical protein
MRTRPVQSRHACHSSHTGRSWRCTLMNLGVKPWLAPHASSQHQLVTSQYDDTEDKEVYFGDPTCRPATSAGCRVTTREAARTAAVAGPPGAQAQWQPRRRLGVTGTFEVPGSSFGHRPSFGISASAGRPRQPPCWRCVPSVGAAGRGCHAPPQRPNPGRCSK